MKVNELLEEKQFGQATYDVVLPFIKKLVKEHPKLEFSYPLPGVEKSSRKPHLNYFYITIGVPENKSLDKLAADNPELLAKIAERKKKHQPKVSAIDIALEVIKLTESLGEVTSIGIANAKDDDREFKPGTVTANDLEKNFHDDYGIYGYPFVSVMFYFDTKLVKEEKLGIYSKKKKEQEQIDPKAVKKLQKKAPKLKNGKDVLP